MTNIPPTPDQELAKRRAVLELVTAKYEPDTRTSGSVRANARRYPSSATVLALLGLVVTAGIVSGLSYILTAATPAEISAIDPASCEGNLLGYELGAGSVTRYNLAVDRYVCARHKKDDAVQRVQQAALDDAKPH